MKIFPTNSKMAGRERAVGQDVSAGPSPHFSHRVKPKVVRRKLHDALVLISLIALRHRHHVRDFGFL